MRMRDSAKDTQKSLGLFYSAGKVIKAATGEEGCAVSLLFIVVIFVLFFLPNSPKHRYIKWKSDNRKN
jgi:hypothetical protein